MIGRRDGKPAEKENLQKGYSKAESAAQERGRAVTNLREEALYNQAMLDERNEHTCRQRISKDAAGGRRPHSSGGTNCATMIMLAPEESTRRGVDPVRPRCNMTNSARSGRLLVISPAAQLGVARCGRVTFQL